MPKRQIGIVVQWQTVDGCKNGHQRISEEIEKKGTSIRPKQLLGSYTVEVVALTRY